MKKLLLLVLLLGSFAAFSQGVTTSSINGRVVDDAGEPLTGATVVALHTESGTKYGAITDFDGFYRVPNMRPGGPYIVTITYVGYSDFVRNDVYLGLGESKRIGVNLAESASALDEVVITTQRDNVFDSNKTGTETTVTERDILTLPATSRSIADFVRITPQAQITEGSDGFSVSLGGQNNRYNAIYIDGAVNNDVFGLAGSGTNGGQTGVNPFSVDAIETFQVNVAPFDVRQSGFSGGSINAITRSGTNDIEGSVYGFLRNESFAGKTPPSLVGEGETEEKLEEFSALTYGMRVGGPIIKDKLFYFINYERQDDETPQPFNFSNYTGRSTLDDINGLRNFLINTYGYDPGGFDANTLFCGRLFGAGHQRNAFGFAVAVATITAIVAITAVMTGGAAAVGALATGDAALIIVILVMTVVLVAALVVVCRIQTSVFPAVSIAVDLAVPCAVAC